MSRKLLTLVLIREQHRVLLGLKKRGFGAGRWNGFGGKVQTGESIEAAARRETKEECGIDITAMEEVGIHEFRFTAKPNEVLEVHVFRGDRWVGEPVETEEMRPQWFAIDAVPYGEMWPVDKLWIPIFLKNKMFRTYFLYGEGDAILEHHVKVVGGLTSGARASRFPSGLCLGNREWRDQG